MGVDQTWIGLQADLCQELAFRRRFKVASERAYHFYCFLVTAPIEKASASPLDIFDHNWLLKANYQKLLEHYGLRMPSQSDTLSTGYLNLALHALRDGNNPALASDFFMTAIAAFRHPQVAWATGSSTTNRIGYDVEGALEVLGRRERTLLRLLLRRHEAHWQASEQRRERAIGKHSLIAHEGMACWREITRWRMQADGRIVSAIQQARRSPGEIRAYYLSKHESNPYRRGLEWYEAVAGSAGECLAWGPVPEAILFYPAGRLVGLRPSLLGDTPPGAWFAPNNRLSKLARASVPVTDDIEEILRSLFLQVDGDCPGISRLALTTFLYVMADLGKTIDKLGEKR